MSIDQDAVGAAGVGINALSGNWVGAALGAVGLGMQIFGGVGQSNVAQQEAKVSQNEAQQEIGINNAKQQAMQLQAQRTQIENVRNIQRARAQGVNAAVSQGAQYGSGLQGGLAQSSSQGLFNIVGVNSAVQTGTQINAFNNQISNDKMQMAALGGQSATDQGIMSLGGSLMKAAPGIGQFAKGFGGGSSGGFGLGSIFMGGGSPTGL